MRIGISTILMVLCTVCYGQQSSVKNYPAIDDYITHLKERQGIPGVSIAIIKGDSILYKNNYGYANLEHQVPISNTSIFRIYSLTKLSVSVGIFQLIEEGKVSLDDAVSKYVFDLPASWNDIKIKNLLTHSSGLPDMAPLPDFKDLSEEEAKSTVFQKDLKFNPGEKYDYNQTGFWVLQKIIEKVKGEDLATFILENQFSDDTNVFFSSDSRDIVLNRVTPYFPFEKGTLMIDHSYLQGAYAHAKNGLNLSLDEFINWDKALRAGKFLSKKYMEVMWEAYPFSETTKRFTYGWDEHSINGHSSYGFSGSMCTAYRVFPGDELSVIFLSNGLTNWYNIDNIINHIVSLVEEDITDLNNLAFESILKASVEKNQDDFKAAYQKIKSSVIFNGNDFEMHLNDVGYFWLFSLKNPQKAIEIFELNTAEFPTSWNAFDSLAEAYVKTGNVQKAIRNYEKAIARNENADYKYNTELKIEELRK